MKKTTKLLALFLVLILVIGMLTACGTKKTEEDNASTTTDIQTENTEDTATADDNSDTQVEEVPEDTWSWPLEEKKELSIWLTFSNNFLESPDDVISVQKIEENTNVHVNWVQVALSESGEKFGLMMASGDYPDILRGAGSYYSGGLQQACEDGVIYDLTEYVPKYMPNYQALRASSEKLAKDTVTDDGRMIGVYTIASNFGTVQGEKVWGGTCIRQDWLDELGLDTPVTIDDWHEVLVAFKENYNCEAPLLISSSMGHDGYMSFVSAYGVLGGYYNDNGTVKYGALEDGYKQWVQLFRDWYAEGLIDPNFLTNDATYMGAGEYLGTGRAGAGANIFSLTADMYKMYGFNQEEDFFLAAVAAPVLNEGDTPQVGGYPMSEIIKEALVVTTNCTDIELACRYLDYWFSEENMMLDSMGIEGESYIDNGDGTYSLGPAVLDMVANGEMPTTEDALNLYTMGSNRFGLYNWGKYDMIYEGNRVMEAKDIWNVEQYDMMLPPSMTMTGEETIAFGTKNTAIQTLVTESVVQFINGTKSMDEYDAFVQSLYDYGIEECIGYQQAALDRYNAR